LMCARLYGRRSARRRAERCTRQVRPRRRCSSRRLALLEQDRHRPAGPPSSSRSCPRAADQDSAHGVRGPRSRERLRTRRGRRPADGLGDLMARIGPRGRTHNGPRGRPRPAAWVRLGGSSVLDDGLDQHHAVVDAVARVEAMPDPQDRVKQQLARGPIGAVLGGVARGVDRELLSLLDLEVHGDFTIG
jgi:hypothetical protein